MASKNYTQQTNEQLLSSFISTSQDWLTCVETKPANINKAERLDDNLYEISAELLKRGEEAVRNFSALLRSPEEVLRLKSANFLIDVEPNSKEVLKELSQNAKNGEVAFFSRTTLMLLDHLGA